ncbi:MAG: methionine adenosyltransferase [Candidatus Aenigmarchaeota archaeon]|nr:methionine adenosyltransferase [Candidatus Aenigmarchaeota archaeon]
MKLSIEKMDKILAVPKQKVELVERKGIGHPDSLTDGLCEASSRIISKYYIENKGFICHHNLDKGLLVGGVANPTFGGGKVIETPDVTVAGTATILGSGDDLRKLIYEEVDTYLTEKLRFVDDLNPEIFVKIHPGSQDLVGVYERFNKGQVPLANDTSIGVGYAPYSKLEKMVLDIEKFLNNPETKKKYPFVGEDIKVMGYRKGDNITITSAIAWVSKFVSSLDEYYEQKEKLKELLEKKFTDGKTKLFMNTADKKDSIYLTVSGTSWENGDDGQVGRGNRINGLITPCRPMSLEAAAGKNPVSHVGKVYNFKAQEIAEKIESMFGIDQVYVQLLSQIGKPINEPYVGIKYISGDGIDDKEVKQVIEKSLSMEGLQEFRGKMLEGKLSVF